MGVAPRRGRPVVGEPADPRDAIWTTAHGKRLFGRDGIYEVSHVLFTRPDVAAVKIRQRHVSPDGEHLEVAEGSPLCLLSEEDGSWKIAVGQNTIVL